MMGTHPDGKDVKRRLSPHSLCYKVIDLRFVLAMSALNMNARIPRLFRTYKAPEYQSPKLRDMGRPLALLPLFQHY